jgi:hypothetical protein
MIRQDDQQMTELANGGHLGQDCEALSACSRGDHAERMRGSW